MVLSGSKGINLEEKIMNNHNTYNKNAHSNHSEYGTIHYFLVSLRKPVFDFAN